MTANQFTVHEAHHLLKTKQLSSVELTKACLERIHQIEPKLRALVTTTDEVALKAAQRADELITTGDVFLLCTETLNFVTPTGGDPFEIESFRNESQFKGVRLRVAPMMQLECTAPYHNYRITDVAACATS